MVNLSRERKRETERGRKEGMNNGLEDKGKGGRENGMEPRVRIKEGTGWA